MNIGKQELIEALSEQLKIMIKKPEWADFVKTGVFKERPPMIADWWYMRAASMLLKIDKLGIVGVSKLRTKYGGRKNRGVAPEHTYRGSGKIIRTILQQLEVAGLLKQDKKGLHKGRVLTPKAHSLIAQTARALEKSKPKAEKKEHADKKEAVKEEEHKKEEVKKEEIKEEVKANEVKGSPPIEAQIKN